MSVETIRVAISERVIEQLIELPKPTVKKVNEWIQEFRQNPTASGLNFERIQKARAHGGRRQIQASPVGELPGAATKAGWPRRC